MEQEQIFRPVGAFSWEVNRSERALQARWLVPLLDLPEGRVWFLGQLQCPCSPEEAAAAEVFHFCFPLRDVLTADFKTCRGKRTLEDQLIPYYNRLFGLPDDFGIEEIWHTGPDGAIRHPAAGGRAGWHEDFLDQRVPDKELHVLARNMRRMLGTEPDVLLITDSCLTVVECKFLSNFLKDEYERQLMMGNTLAERLGKGFHYGLVAQERGDPAHVHIDAPCVLWSEVEAKLKEIRR